MAARASRGAPPDGGAENGGRSSSWLPEELAATCFRRKRLPSRSRGAASRSSLQPTVARHNTAHISRPRTRMSSRARPCAGVRRSPSCVPRRRSVSGIAKAWRLLGRLRPAVVVGFGGYPTIPPLMAATHARHSDLIHEQNAVMGRANRLLAPPRHRDCDGVSRACSGRQATLDAKATHTGNPVRPAVIAAAATPYATLTGATSVMRILVFGGSQGARIMADIVPEAIARLDPCLRARLFVSHQTARGGPRARAAAYATAGVQAEVATFFAHLPELMAARAARDRALGRVDRRRACRDRPPGDPGAVAPRARSGPARQRQGAGRRRRRYRS